MSSFPANPSMPLALPCSTSWVGRDRSVEEQVLNLFELMWKRLLRYAVSFGISVQDGEDIVQETFLALFHHLQQNRSDENLDGWLFRVTHNLALKRRLKVVREPVLPDLQELERLDPDPNPEEHMLF